MVTVADSDGEIGLESDLGWALGRIFRSYVKTFDAVLDDVPGGPRGYQVLAAATHGSPPSQLALAQHLGIDRTVMTYLIDDLVTAGLVERRPDTTDRRARRIVATEQGAQLLHTLERELASAEEHLLAPLGDDERGALRALLRRIAEHVQRFDPVANTCQAVDDVRHSNTVP
ncbi:MarR family transcriptional regulator [Actinobacteria bacterium YIM 96077]|uniref:MarR family transcriptional regulator n=1 Tax=Phytoactinopolyspora halophila TaxID=1981511 RepID=A0A329QN24_9ACTN|nr:MarR family winged helix-turn-helix transcriptional regulator [Phytoactinopolyspora halophila]AYY12328.1 MarR family transcriptional regulator [Actinobacteria bacterium YIM 96077]RAW13754.1 MarR family transcriptional regulator [Phytoactinopolyspora halophila]